jgi:hypothetical protein
MKKLCLIALLLGSVLFGVSLGTTGTRHGEPAGGIGPADDNSLKVAITTGGGLFGPTKAVYKVNEEIPVTISLTNNGAKPAKYCLSTAVFQNKPTLRKDGQLLPYVTNLSRDTETKEWIQRCEMSQSRRFYDLQPKETKDIDWFTLNSGAINWYGDLKPGRYDLVLERRVECCQGTALESNKISFEIVP